MWQATLLPPQVLFKMGVMRKYQLLCLIAILVLGCCTDRPEPAKSAQSSDFTSPPTPAEPAVATEESERTVEAIIRGHALEKSKQTSLLRTWTRIPNHKAYRAVRPSDIKIPSWVKQEYYWGDVARGIGWASDYGEMSGAYGLIVFVVDKSIVDANRFSLVAFIERPGNRYTIHWIKQNEDLSRVLLGRHSGNVYLVEYLEDRKRRFCDVQWTSTTRKWGCELKDS